MFHYCATEYLSEFCVSLCGDMPQDDCKFACEHVSCQFSFDSYFGFRTRVQVGTLAFSFDAPKSAVGFFFSFGSFSFESQYRLLDVSSDFYCTISASVFSGTKLYDKSCAKVIDRYIPKSYASSSRTVLGWRL